MPLEPGTQLGPYEILAPLGAGGMGEVYKAQDQRLDRLVALKVLPQHLARDPHLRDRLEREARAISALNHRHICTLYDIGREDGVDFLIMEYLEGKTLADRLERGSLPLAEALELGAQIADALDEAHRHGVVHRDLKPGNIILTKDGVKLLDFGLAKLIERPSDAADLSSLPTENKPLTEEGTILGTIQYMAPEQLEGEEADQRTDIFALGAVSYEMLTGRKAFEGKSRASLIGAIMNHDPAPVSTIEPLSPAALDHLVRTCLDKSADDRWQSASDVARQLRWIAREALESAGPAPLPAARRKHTIGWALAALLVGSLGGLSLSQHWRDVPLTTPTAGHFKITLPEGSRMWFARGNRRPSLAISPDGSHLAYLAQSGSDREIYLRRIDEVRATPIPDTRGASNLFFSPDGQWLGFRTYGDVKKVRVTGGRPQTIGNARGWRGASWGPDSVIVLGQSTEQGLSLLPANGGEPETLTTPDTEAGEIAHVFPDVLPGDRAVLFTVEEREGSRIALLSLATKEVETVLESGTAPIYVDTGHMLYEDAQSLWAVPFDLERLEVTGTPVRVIERAAGFVVSRTGILVYDDGIGSGVGSARALVWVDRNGAETPIPAEHRAYVYPRISPDGSRAAFDVRDVDGEIWIWHFERETLSRFTFAESDEQYPLWSRDGRQIFFASGRDVQGIPGNLYRKSADGSGSVVRLTESANGQSPFTVSVDDSLLVHREIHDGNEDLYLLDLEDDGGSEPLLASPAAERNAEISPDGRWMAYESDGTGRFEIYVRPFPDVETGGMWQISRRGGTRPLWGPDGRELLYLDPAGRLMAVPVETEGTFAHDPPTVLLDGAYATPNLGRTYDIHPDGSRFLRIKSLESSELHVIVNWFEELERITSTED